VGRRHFIRLFLVFFMGGRSLFRNTSCVICMGIFSFDCSTIQSIYKFSVCRQKVFYNRCWIAGGFFEFTARTLDAGCTAYLRLQNSFWLSFQFLDFILPECSTMVVITLLPAEQLTIFESIGFHFRKNIASLHLGLRGLIRRGGTWVFR
jgi:hypothetical protein